MSRNDRSSFVRTVSLLSIVSVAAGLAAVGCNTGAANFLNFGGTRGQSDALSPNAPAGSPLPTADALGGGSAAEIARDIEEADVVKQVGDKIYLLNAYKGLVVVDVANPDQPKVLGSLDLRGRGVEMYVVGSQAFVVLSADFGYYYPVAYAGGGVATRALEDSFVPPPQPEFSGSQVAIIDVSKPAEMKSLGKINLVGYAEQSRRVGSVLYIAGSTLGSWEVYPLATDGAAPPSSSSAMYENRDRGFVASINIADPANIQAVERKTLTGGALSIHVSTDAIFAASNEYDYNSGNSFTRVQYVDISDPTGKIELRDSFTVPGSIRNRFFMDSYNGTFRICTDNWGFGFRTAKLFTYDIADPADVTELGSVEIIRGETLQAVRYDGAKAYAVTFLVVDPLFVINLSNPASPQIAGQLKVPGYSTHIEPRGDRLIAVGIDDTAGQRPAVAYYDVSNPAAPKELGRVILGPPNSYTDSQATYDEKAFKIIDSLKMIVIPFNHTEYVYVRDGEDDGRNNLAIWPNPQQMICTNGVQIVDFSDTALIQRGWFDARSRVSRVGQVGSRVFAISDVALETVNIDDRDHPTKAGEALFVPEVDVADYDGCGYYYPYPIDFPTDVVLPDIDAQALAELLRTLLDSGACGVTSALPGALMIAGLMFMWPGRRRKY